MWFDSMDKNKKDILIGFIILALEIILLYFFWKNNKILAVAFLIMSVFVLLLWTNKGEKVLYFTGFILLPLYDLILVSRGVWSYGNPTIYGVPIWLPFAYGLGTVMIVKIGNSVSRIYFKQ